MIPDYAHVIIGASTWWRQVGSLGHLKTLKWLSLQILCPGCLAYFTLIVAPVNPHGSMNERIMLKIRIL